jgi:hypothetical protein
MKCRDLTITLQQQNCLSGCGAILHCYGVGRLSWCIALIEKGNWFEYVQ